MAVTFVKSGRCQARGSDQPLKSPLFLRENREHTNTSREMYKITTKGISLRIRRGRGISPFALSHTETKALFLQSKLTGVNSQLTER